MLTFLFWNILKRDLRSQLGALIETHKVDALILAESPYSSRELGEMLDGVSQRKFSVAETDCERIQLATTSSLAGVESIHDEIESRLTMWRFDWHSEEMFLAAVHLPSMAQMPKPADRQKIASRAAQKIREKESKSDHSRTILVGDFNMDPYEDGLVSSDAFHALMTEKLVERGHRTVQFESLPMFYNPMWSCYGDRTPGPPGTYYHSESNPGAQFWHMLDQVLVRASLMDRLHDVRILDQAGDKSLLNNLGRPDIENASDHLPILFRLSLNKE